jgi:rhamnose transport system permease protein
MTAAAPPRPGLRAMLATWEGFLLMVLIALVVLNVSAEAVFLTTGNLINMFQLSIEKIIVALAMTFVIVNAEIDLSVASVMGFVACAFGRMVEAGVPAGWAIVIGLGLGALCGAFNALWIVGFGLPSLVVTLATMIAYRGFARILLEDRGIGDFPDWFDRLGQQGLVGPVPLAMIIFVVMAVLAWVILQRSAFGRKVYFIGANRAVADYSGIEVARIKTTIFVAASTVAALAGLLYAARLGAVRGDFANGFELDVITIVLLGGISIFGGSGTMTGTILAILIVLALRNGMSLANITGHLQTGALGILLIVAALVPTIRDALKRRRTR